ncbi:LysM peptidoglycan-binding domain-containing protein [Tessaracoccus sp. HDW20]|nr:LysM peptidoglycan-binding domain-containing protein [Tessaracoccus coleopterorum]
MSTAFPPTSRYATVEVAVLETATGEEIAYLRRRTVPQPESFALLGWHEVTQGDRLDNVTATHLGDPEQFWRIADANRALRPDDLIELGRRLRITLPAGSRGFRCLRECT